MFKRIAGFIARKVIVGAVKALALQTVGAVVQDVEEKASQSPAKWTGEMKREMAIDMLIARLDIPYISDAQERVLWGIVIDMMVGVFKTYVWGRVKGQYN